MITNIYPQNLLTFYSNLLVSWILCLLLSTWSIGLPPPLPPNIYCIYLPWHTKLQWTRILNEVCSSEPRLQAYLRQHDETCLHLWRPQDLEPRRTLPYWLPGADYWQENEQGGWQGLGKSQPSLSAWLMYHSSKPLYYM